MKNSIVKQRIVMVNILVLALVLCGYLTQPTNAIEQESCTSIAYKAKDYFAAEICMPLPIEANNIEKGQIKLGEPTFMRVILY